MVLAYFWAMLFLATPFSRGHVGTFDVAEEDLEEIPAKMEKYNVQLLDYFANSLERRLVLQSTIAAHVEDHGRIKSVLVDYLRDSIEEMRAELAALEAGNYGHFENGEKPANKLTHYVTEPADTLFDEPAVSFARADEEDEVELTSRGSEFHPDDEEIDGEANANYADDEEESVEVYESVKAPRRHRRFVNPLSSLSSFFSGSSSEWPEPNIPYVVVPAISRPGRPLGFTGARGSIPSYGGVDYRAVIYSDGIASNDVVLDDNNIGNAFDDGFVDESTIGSPTIDFRA